MKHEITSAPSFTESPFPYVFKPGVDTNYKGLPVVIPPGTTIPDYIRIVYGISTIEPVNAYFPFLSRDMDVKRYVPHLADPFVFKDRTSLDKFKRSVLTMINDVNKMWVNYGLPLKTDKDRRIQMPDSSAIIAALRIAPSKRNEQEKKYADIYDKNKEDLGAIISNVDILKKCSIVRTVLPGWFATSYSGQNSPNPKYFKKAIEILVSAMVTLKRSPRWSSVYDSTLADQGDPLYTANGWPYYVGITDEDDNPVTKIKTVTKYEGCFKKNASWTDIKDTMSKRGTNSIETKHLFAIATIRRKQYGYKVQHLWEPTSAGLKFVKDVRGFSTTRVAWMAPYILNLIVSPIQTEWKALRKLIPGLFHDGPTRAIMLQELAKGGYYIIESDFSNYDKTIPNNVMSMFFDEYISRMKYDLVWRDILAQTHKDLPIIWGDNIGGRRDRGWVFKVPELALLSGLKITSEIGTFMNMIINIAGWLNTGSMSEATILKYLTSRNNDASANPVPWVSIASDDTLIATKDPDLFSKLIVSFEEGAKNAGIKSEIEIGDKFLMRHMARGKDLPVLARIFQNTLQNEESTSDPIKFLVGLAIRTDGVGGFKTFDPFNTGKKQGMSPTERDISLIIISQLLSFLETAFKPLLPGVDLITDLLKGITQAKLTNGKYYVSSYYTGRVDKARYRFLDALAKRELNALANMKSSQLQSSYVMDLIRNDQSPMAQLALETIVKSSSSTANFINELKGKEHTFYVWAMNKVGIPLKPY